MSNESLKEALLVEKYKYVLDRRKGLNDATFKIVSVYQALIIVISAVQLTILDRVKSHTLDISTGRLASDIVVGMNVAVSVITFLLILGGVFAWFNYREDENEILLVQGLPIKKKVRLRDLFSWYETYIALVLIVIPVLHRIVIGKML